MSTVCMLYGLAEGPLSGKQFKQALIRADFKLCADPAKADIIFAHSAGCYLIPDEIMARLVVIVDVPYWPGKSTLTGVWQKVSQEFRFRRWQKQQGLWLSQMLKHGLYICSPVALYRLARDRQAGRFWQVAQPLLVIRNQDDVFCTPDLKSLPFKVKPIFAELPGQHDDCWYNPEPYIELIKQHYG